MIIVQASSDFQGPGLKVQVTVAIFRKAVIALVPTFIDGFQCKFTQILGMLSHASSTSDFPSVRPSVCQHLCRSSTFMSKLVF